MTDAIEAGAEIGGYRLNSLLGKGGMSAVYLAEQAGTGDRVALKVLAAELAESESFRERFLRESRHARSLDHPNVVRVRDAGEDEGRLWMSMDYVEGSDLATLLSRQGPLDLDRALGLLGQVAAALDAVHAAGIVHRDLKPGNVIVASGPGAPATERAYLMDFGLSKRPTEEGRALTGPGDYVGTPFYIAPEQILGQELDHRADVYSLGAVLYECVVGAPPFVRDSEADVLSAHVQEPPPKPSERRPGLPEAIDEVVGKAMRKEPSERYGSCAELTRAAWTGASAAAPGGAPAEAAERLRLKVTEGNACGTEIVVDDELVIGRDAGGEGRLADDIEISRRHARIARSSGGYSLEDLGSTNGTFLNGRRIGSPQALDAGDRVQVGGTTLVVQVSLRPAAVSVDTPTSPPATGPEPAAREAVEQPCAGPAEAEPAEQPARREPENAPLPKLSLRIEIDPAAGEARVELDEASEPLRLVFEDGRWRLAPGP